MVPEGWRFPSTDVKATWNLRHFGHVHERIRPLRHLKKADLMNSSQISVWSKCRGVKKAIVEEMVDRELVHSVEEVEKLTTIDSAAAFDRAIVQLIERVKAGATRGRGRWMEMSIPTMDDYLGSVRNRKRKREEEEKEEVQTDRLD
jgi:hypothetical protein